MKHDERQALLAYLLTLPLADKEALARALAKALTREQGYRCPDCPPEIRDRATRETQGLFEPQATIVRARICTVLLADMGMRPFTLSETTLWRWRDAYREHGAQGLISRKSPGRPRKA